MSVTGIGNLTYINQNAQVSSSVQSANQHRADIANLANMQDFQNKLDAVAEVRKLEENEAINPDADSQNQSQQQDRQESPQQQEEQEAASSEHLLDIRA
ncbi:hypothetical protein BBW65_03840 [Helicobacter enhydrae]|uniref:Uncharacterized protein n=1 Tax=Helicobacter enhydrae TaxID=222136 RepID=A0A1B1U5L0_9HELI|nr:hypothetical protein [Helicobacter enhydrae]ANV97982.1 hypothetical protein BBW65_03840 [Helicobacter enhydrae]